MKTVLTFLRDVRKEMHRVTWPDRAKTIRYSWLVVGISVAVAVFLGILDYIFSTIIESFF